MVKELCPLCRTEVLHRRLNCQLQGIIETFFKAHPNRKRGDDELMELDKKVGLGVLECGFGIWSIPGIT